MLLRKETAETCRTGHLLGSICLFILTRDDSDNFSGSLSKTRTKVMIHWDTSVTRVACASPLAFSI
jgi:hypothetical protein